MAKHGQREHDENSRRGREQGEGWRSDGQRDFGRQGDGSEQSGFTSRRGNGHGQEDMEDFSQRRGGPESSRGQESWRGRGESSGSGWGPEQEFGQGSYRGDRRSWEGEERGSFMDRQRDTRRGGWSRGGYGQEPYGGYRERERGWSEPRGRYGESGGWAPGEHGGRQSGFGSGQGFGSGLAGFGSASRVGTGPHAGRGPKGYRRSDERIQEDVSEQLTQHPDIDASDVEIKVQSGEVTLTGTVDSRQCKRMVEDLVESASGVKEVSNQLRVKQRHDTGSGSEGAGTSETHGNRSRA